MAVQHIGNEIEDPFFPSMLVVGNIHAWAGSDQSLPSIPGIVFVDYRDLGPHISADRQPDIILSAVVGHGFDAVELATILQTCGFRGRYRGVATSLPRPELIRGEVRTRAPDVDFDILELEILAQVSGGFANRKSSLR